MISSSKVAEETWEPQRDRAPWKDLGFANHDEWYKHERFKSACQTRLRFRGNRTIGDIGSTDEGLLELFYFWRHWRSYWLHVELKPYIKYHETQARLRRLRPDIFGEQP